MDGGVTQWEKEKEGRLEGEGSNVSSVWVWNSGERSELETVMCIDSLWRPQTRMRLPGHLTGSEKSTGPEGTTPIFESE